MANLQGSRQFPSSVLGKGRQMEVLIAWRGGLARFEGLLGKRPRLLEAGLAALGFVVLLAFYRDNAVNSVGASDSYGYLSEALRLAKGHFYEPERVLSPFGLPENSWITHPLAYTEHGREGTVPTYPFGYPLLLVPLILTVGTAGTFWVTPFLAAGTVVLTYYLARVWLGYAGSVIAAVLLFAFPNYIFGATQFFSDVPATFFAVLALWALFHPRPRLWRNLLLGFAAGYGVWVRPNMMLLVIAIVAWLLWRHDLRRLGAFAGALAPFLIVEALLNQRLYGSPWASGYGALPWAATLREALDRGWRYLLRLHEQQAWVGLFLVVLGLTIGRLSLEVRVFILGLGTLFLVFFSYYAIDDAWWYGRFLLPTLPAAVILEAAGLERLLEKGRWLPYRAGAVSLGVVAIVWVSMAWSQDHSVFALQTGEMKYPRAAQMASENVQQPALVLTMIHSGALRLYGGLPTIRYDAPLGELLSALRAVERAGGSLYLLADEWEVKAEIQGRDRAILLEGARETARITSPNVVLLRLAPLPPDPTSFQAQHPLRLSLGGELGLRGFALSSAELHHGDNLKVTLFWQALAKPKHDYTVFTQLLDEEGKLVAQADSYPLENRYPTSWWSPGYIVSDTHEIALPTLGRPATLTLIAGMYRLETMERLSIADETGTPVGDHVVLGTIVLREK